MLLGWNAGEANAGAEPGCHAATAASADDSRAQLAVRGLRRQLATPKPPATGFELTRIEWKIARLMLDGLTNAEVSRTEGLSPDAVESYVRRIVQKVGARRTPPPPRAAWERRTAGR